MIQQFTKDNFEQYCTALAARDEHLQGILHAHGYPPLWSRPASFESVVHIILEQQVSLASAKAALEKLREKMGEIEPAGFLLLSDEELKACYFSRQKISYVRDLAKALHSNELDLQQLSFAGDEDVRTALKKIKGIVDWTVDVYLLFVLQRLDVFPVGDLAMVNALKEIKQLPKETTKEEMLAIAESWRPHRSLATMLLWHHYLKSKVKTTSPKR